LKGQETKPLINSLPLPSISDVGLKIEEKVSFLKTNFQQSPPKGNFSEVRNQVNHKHQIKSKQNIFRLGNLRIVNSGQVAFGFEPFLSGFIAT
jgi:hypothetical protein